jgi:hypothetical protein
VKFDPILAKNKNLIKIFFGSGQYASKPLAGEISKKASRRGGELSPCLWPASAGGGEKGDRNGFEMIAGRSRERENSLSWPLNPASCFFV